MSAGLRRVASLALGPLLLLAACHRSAIGVGGVATGGRDGGRDVGAEAAGDGGAADAGDARASDATPADAGGGDRPRDGGGVCPAGVGPLDVCGCGCCGPGPQSTVCYYPALGDTRDAIPDPHPTANQCATAGCSLGVRHLCCADRGLPTTGDDVCAQNTSVEDLPRFTITRRDGATCTTLELWGVGGAQLPISGPPGFVANNAWRRLCDGSAPGSLAIGGLGSISPSQIKHGDTMVHYDVHMVLFFDDGTGTADAVRIDADDVPVSQAACFADAGDGGGADDGGDASGDSPVLGCTPGTIIPGSCNVCSCTAAGVWVCSESARACIAPGDGGGN